MRTRLESLPTATLSRTTGRLAARMSPSPAGCGTFLSRRGFWSWKTDGSKDKNNSSKMQKAAGYLQPPVTDRSAVSVAAASAFVLAAAVIAALVLRTVIVMVALEIRER